jgi:hypothetical protein
MTMIANMVLAGVANLYALALIAFLVLSAQRDRRLQEMLDQMWQRLEH